MGSFVNQHEARGDAPAHILAGLQPKITVEWFDAGFETSLLCRSASGSTFKGQELAAERQRRPQRSSGQRRLVDDLARVG